MWALQKKMDQSCLCLCSKTVKKKKNNPALMVARWMGTLILHKSQHGLLSLCFSYFIIRMSIVLYTYMCTYNIIYHGPDNWADILSYTSSHLFLLFRISYTRIKYFDQVHPPFPLLQVPLPLHIPHFMCSFGLIPLSLLSAVNTCTGIVIC